MPASPSARFAASLSTAADSAAAVAEVTSRAVGTLAGPPDLGFFFVSHHHAGRFDELAAELRERTGARCLLGCAGESIVGDEQEIEDQPALSLWLAHLPGASIVPLELAYERTPDGGTFVGWPDDLPETWPAGSALLLLGEPFTFPADMLLARLHEDQPGVPVIGGMASGGSSPGENRLFLDGREIAAGAVGVLLSGGVRVRTVVSQGCRPIGRHFVVTKSERNVILELGGRPPLAVLREIFPTLSAAEQRMLQSGLHVGLAASEYKETFGRGDFVVRNVVGADNESGAIAIGDWVRNGQTVQFHLRDAASADEDLRELLRAAPGASSPASGRGALLFTCNGRGTRLFPEPHHDAALVRRELGEIPLAGFFAQGELGPIGGKNFIHGFTASVAVLEAD